MDPLAVHEAPLGLAASAPHQDDGSWGAMGLFLDADLLRWLDSVGFDNKEDAASSTSRPTSPSLPPSQPAPVLPPVTPIAEDYADQVELMVNPSPASANPSYDAASQGEKRLRPKQLAKALRFWLERCHTPYPTLEEKTLIAEALQLSVAQVTNFSNNNRNNPAYLVLSAVPIAEDYADQYGLTLAPSPDAAAPSSHAEKRFRPKALTNALRFWMERLHRPYATLEEKKLVAEALEISVAQVTNFCNNYRKRFAKVGNTLTSYSKLASWQ
ncbi:hypothetical protein T484DRAFT_2025807 [Baffinella frigidus]|nr:hypothetical protein T484DRAFT_2025807 [Cryptophyta sp. CCMP2293]